MIDTAVDALSSTELQVGLVIGSIGFGIVLLASGVVALVRRKRSSAWSRAPVAVAGILMAIGGAIAIARTSSFPRDAAIALLLLAVGGFVARRSMAVGFLLAVPGAAVLADALPNDERWISVAVFVAVVLGSAGTASFDRRYSMPALGPLLFGLSTCAVYVTVPDTERALALMGAVVPLALTGWPLRLARLGNAGAFASVGVLAWVVGVEGPARPSAVIGGLACLGVLALEPIFNAFVQLSSGRTGSGDTPPTSTSAALVMTMLHVVILLLVARVAGRTASASAALVVVALVSIGATLVLGWRVRHQRVEAR